MREIFADNKDEIAGVILEPVVGNSGFIEPTQEFLEVDIAVRFRTQLRLPQNRPSPVVLRRVCFQRDFMTEPRGGSYHRQTCFSVQGLREITREEGALLCFDEVMTGFRIAKGCAQVRSKSKRRMKAAV